MAPTPDDEELADRVAELEETLEQLRRELRQPPTGPLGLPRPPTPRELLEFTDRFAIPTAIAILEANIRALTLLQRLIRLADAERTTQAEADRMRGRAEAISRVTLEQLDSVLEELQKGSLPSEPESRRLLEDARRLRAELGEWLEEGDRMVADSAARERELTEDSDDDRDPLEIDVDEELRSIRAELEEDRAQAGEPTADGTNGDGSTAATGAGDADDEKADGSAGSNGPSNENSSTGGSSDGGSSTGGSSAGSSSEKGSSSEAGGSSEDGSSSNGGRPDEDPHRT